MQSRGARRDDVLPFKAMTLRQRYEAWRDTPHGETVFQMCAEIASRLVQRGFRTYGMHGVIETARWHYAIRVGPQTDMEGFKISNNHEPYMAREMTARGIVPDGFFRRKPLKEERNGRR